MDRRTFLAGTGAVLLVAPLVAEAQQAGKVWRIGVLANSTPAAGGPLLQAFREGLRELGNVEGQNIVLEVRFEERQELLDERAAELVRLGVDVFLTAASPATFAAKRATTSIPIVMVAVEIRRTLALLRVWRAPAGTSLALPP